MSALVLWICWSLAGAALAQQEAASVLVRVTDEAGVPVGDQAVAIDVHDGDRLVGRLDGVTDNDGAVLFSDVPSGPGYRVQAVVEYGGYPYRGEPTELVDDRNVTLSMRVYNTTSAGTPLHIDMLHVVLNVVEPGFYQAIQVMSVRNVAEKAFLGEPGFEGQPVGMVIPVPTGASQVAPLPPEMSGLDTDFLAVDEDRLVDLRPVPPGLHQVGISYELVTGSEGADIELTLPYPTAQVSLLVGPGLDDVEIDAPTMVEQAPQEIPNQGAYAHWTSDVIDAGGTLVFHVGPRRPPLSAAAWSLIALGAALFAGVAASIWGGVAPERGQESRLRLVEEVARLDRDYLDGRVADGDYYQRRGNAIERILEIDHGAGRPTESQR